ncbi:hypothetical protein [Mycobacterium sp. DL592]|uniref:hypothetical protein n=1 Tax=Mycobacterium sp. DL592 TaxID=2675524 RepID=UPI001AAFF792|nr:hypothetical protein [Mycobacterium sp. DL592]
MLQRADSLRQHVARRIQDGALQDLLVARQELVELSGSSDRAGIDRAVASLDVASTQLREAVFDLNPVVIERIGLADAIELIARQTELRSGIAIVTDVDDAGARSSAQPIVLGAVREVLCSVVPSAQATQADITLRVVDDGISLDITFDCPRAGSAAEDAGLAAQRARIEVSGGQLAAAEAQGTARIHIEMPIRDQPA